MVSTKKTEIRAVRAKLPPHRRTACGVETGHGVILAHFEINENR
jgi:hypothetical protein